MISVSPFAKDKEGAVGSNASLEKVSVAVSNTESDLGFHVRSSFEKYIYSYRYRRIQHWFLLRECPSNRLAQLLSCPFVFSRTLITVSFVINKS